MINFADDDGWVVRGYHLCRAGRCTGSDGGELFQHDQHRVRSRLQHQHPVIGCRLPVCDVDILAHINTAGRPPRLGMCSVTDGAFQPLIVCKYIYLFLSGLGRAFWGMERTGYFCVSVPELITVCCGGWERVGEDVLNDSSYNACMERRWRRGGGGEEVEEEDKQPSEMNE